MKVYLGIDVGSVTTKLAVVDENGKYVESYMLRTAGQPTKAVQKGLGELLKKPKPNGKLHKSERQVQAETLRVLLSGLI